ncbi:signal recognition particle-docking protein FtsY [Pseudochrobactrum sp. XF203]|nr:signal recognition particle-docking protein FtsY [Pseudochrobactrum sp. XF203]UCA45552.1 signal recognition particle-docking protein FtsY [Pseudochrobactrum sp. XF203]
MAMGFIKKIFSFGKKEEASSAPSEEVLSPLAEEGAPVAAEHTPVEPHHETVLEKIEDLLSQPVIPDPATIELTPVYDTPEPDETDLEEKLQTEVPPHETFLEKVEELLSQPVIADPATIELTPVYPEAEPEITDADAEVVPAPKPVKVTVSKSVEAKQEPVVVEAEPEKKLSWFERLRSGLSRSSQQLGDSIGGIFTKRKLDEDTLQELEDVLIQADLGLETAMRITDSLSSGRYGKDISTDEVRRIMRSEIEKVLVPVAKPLELDLSHKPHVILVVGVNGTGKTTTIGKLAAKLTAGGLKVMLAAGDTFRAAAIEQLHIWGERTGSPVVSSKLGADAAGLAYDAWQQAKDAGSDVLIIDTAGRLQNKAELMDELAKIVRVLGKHDPEAPHTVLQTLDATTGQNALNQVEIFKNIAGVNGLVMTKLDGSARGGILVAIAAKHKLPVYFVGVGEQIDDLEPFTAQDFAGAIAGEAR